ncbi:MAG TPA: hypothetical protein VFB21_17060 [Chthonomonadaceae bacterium]|nr:hypothetical protein [Chthonomonadaceae bacterium]
MRAKNLSVLQAVTLLLAGMPGLAQAPDIAQKDQAAQEAGAQAEQEAQAEKAEAKAGQDEAKAEQQAKEAAAKARETEHKAKAEVELKLSQKAKALDDADKALEKSLRARILVPSGDYYGLSTFTPLLDQDPRYAVLMRPVDVTLDHATVRQLAEALAKASGLTIVVEKAVPEDVRLTVDARGVPMATVLEAVARQAKLLIAPPPKGSQGVTLKLPPSLQIDNQPRKEFPTLHAPWSDEWFAPQKGAGFPRVYEFAHTLAPTVSADVFGGLTKVARGSSGPFSIAALGDRFLAVAEPSVGSNGESGVLLSLYRLDNGQLKKVSTFFHRLASGEGATARRISIRDRLRAAPDPPRGADAPPPRRTDIPPPAVEEDESEIERELDR